MPGSGASTRISGPRSSCGGRDRLRWFSYSELLIRPHVAVVLGQAPGPAQSSPSPFPSLSPPTPDLFHRELPSGCSGTVHADAPSPSTSFRTPETKDNTLYLPAGFHLLNGGTKDCFSYSRKPWFSDTWEAGPGSGCSELSGRRRPAGRLLQRAGDGQRVLPSVCRHAVLPVL